MTDWQEIARGYYLEALLIDGDRIYYTDVTQGGVRCIGSDSVLLPDRYMVGGLLLNDDGSLLVAGGNGVAWVNPETGASGMLVEGLGGVNEMRADGRGGLLFGTIDLASILEGRPPGPSAIWHVAQHILPSPKGDGPGAGSPRQALPYDPTPTPPLKGMGYSAYGKLTKLQDGLTFANGLSYSADGALLVFNESFHGVNAWPVNPDGSLGPRAWFFDKYDCDGMALDVEGNIWVSGFGSDHLLCLAPDGSEVTRLPLPGAACTNVRFMGADMMNMVVCIVTPEGAQALADGTPITEQNSKLQMTRAPVAGALMGKTSFRF